MLLSSVLSFLCSRKFIHPSFTLVKASGQDRKNSRSECFFNFIVASADISDFIEFSVLFFFRGIPEEYSELCQISKMELFFNRDSLYARVNSHYTAWSYKKK